MPTNNKWGNNFRSWLCLTLSLLTANLWDSIISRWEKWGSEWLGNLPKVTYSAFSRTVCLLETLCCRAAQTLTLHWVGVLEGFVEEIIFELGPGGWEGLMWVEMQGEECFQTEGTARAKPQRAYKRRVGRSVWLECRMCPEENGSGSWKDGSGLWRREISILCTILWVRGATDRSLGRAGH